MAGKSTLVRIIVVFSILCLVQCQQRPTKPLQYYTWITTVNPYNTFKSEIAFDEPNSRFMHKEYDGVNLAYYDVLLSLPFTELSYNNYDDWDYCYLSCCNGIQEESSWSWSWWSPDTSWTASGSPFTWSGSPFTASFSPVSASASPFSWTGTPSSWSSVSSWYDWSTWSSWSSWSSWDAKEEKIEENEENVENVEPIRRYVHNGQVAEFEARGVKVVNPIHQKKSEINFSYERQCEGTTSVPTSLFDDLSRTRYSSLCNYAGRNGNLWSYTDPYGTTIQYCFQTNGTPLYIKYDDNWDGISYVYFDTYTTQVTEDVYTVPSFCGCVVDWSMN